MKNIILCMIAPRRDRTLERCLNSFLPYCDGLSLCITEDAEGPADAELSEVIAGKVTVSLGKKLWLHYYENKPENKGWGHVDDFGDARNTSFDIPSADWYLWADADDVLAPGSGEAIRDLAEKGEHDVFFFDYLLDAQGGRTKRERLIRATCFTGWVNPVHEIATWHEAASVIHYANIGYIHAPEMRRRGSPERNLRILESISVVNRTGPQWAYIASELFTQGQIARGIEAAITATGFTDLSDEIKYKLYLQIGAWMREPEQFERPLLESFRLDPRRAEALIELAQCHLDRGDAAKGWAFLQAAPQYIPNPLPGNHQPECYGWLRRDVANLLLRKLGLPHQKIDHPRITVIHPTCRPDAAIRIRRQWLSRAVHPENIEYIFGVSESDPEVVEKLKLFDCAISQKVPEGHSTAVVNYNAAAMAARGEIVIAAQDDIYAPQGWDVAIWDKMKKTLQQPKVLHLFDGFRQDQIMVIMCVTRKYLKAQGYLLCPEYDGYYSDTEFSIRAYQDKIVIDGRDIHFYHDHPAFTGAAADEEYMRQQNPAATARGKEIFTRRNLQSPKL